jgi:signal transduction histidine kinase
MSIDHIFDPGFTTKGVGVGTGLGLSISYNIIHKHQGALSVKSAPGKGAEFTVSLPLARLGVAGSPAPR